MKASLHSTGHASRPSQVQVYDGRVRIAAAALLLVAAAAVAVAAQPRPYPVYNEYHLDRTMKLVGRNFAGAREALDGGEFESAKALFTRSREQIAVSITYWRHNGRDDGVRMLRDVLENLDALDAALSRPPVAAAAAAALATDAACQTCHAVYREQDPDTGEYAVTLGVG